MTKTQGRIEIRGLRKQFKGGDDLVAAIDGIDLTVAEGEFLCLLGPSGCGKTTTLRSIAGLERPDSGFIRIGDQVVMDSASGRYVPTEKRGLGMVFQSYAIWPHMKVSDNVAYPLTRGALKGKLTKQQVRERIGAILETVDCGHLADRYPSELSGGQQQRVALARALVYEPDVLLFDEPLSNLDAKLRERMRFELRSLQQRVGFTAIYVTHDQQEALNMGDRIAVMKNGSIRQLDTPEMIYQRPVDGYVADFIGTANVLDVQEPLDGSEAFRTSLGPVFSSVEPPADLSAGLQIAIRPEALKLDVPEGATQNVFKGIVRAHAYNGASRSYAIELGGRRIQVVDPQASRSWQVGDSVRFWVSPADCVPVAKDPGFPIPTQPVRTVGG
ncbi:ABC transporter ATP-binding protein [Dactylosporangium sp. NPDC051484]|uniref:ABC transporter ATP-binding protein n=1 Tax=Dactylosporangium sp. NPDC051484 TaxID=3154942 RepID=UPI00344EFCF3